MKQLDLFAKKLRRPGKGVKKPVRRGRKAPRKTKPKADTRFGVTLKKKPAKRKARKAAKKKKTVKKKVSKSPGYRRGFLAGIAAANHMR